MYISLKIVFRFPCAPSFCRHIQGPIWGWFFFMLLIRFPKLFKERFHLKVFVYFIAHYKLILLFFFKFQRSNSNDVEEHKNCLRLKLHHLLLVQNSWCNFKCKLFLYSAVPQCTMVKMFTYRGVTQGPQKSAKQVKKMSICKHQWL